MKGLALGLALGLGVAGCTTGIEETKGTPVKIETKTEIKVAYSDDGFVVLTQIDGKEITFKRDLTHETDSLNIEKGEDSLEIEDAFSDGEVERLNINDLNLSRRSSCSGSSIIYDKKPAGMTTEECRGLFQQADATLKMYKELLKIEEVQKNQPKSKELDIAERLMQ